MLRIRPAGDVELETQEPAAGIGTNQFLGDTDSEERPDRGGAGNDPRFTGPDADGEGY